MSKKYVVPHDMMQAARNANDGISHSCLQDYLEYILASGLQWLAENPMLPNDDQLYELHAYATDRFAGSRAQLIYQLAQWQRIMFLAPGPDIIPNEIKNLLISPEGEKRGIFFAGNSEIYNANIIEAYRRGQKAVK